MTCLYELCLIKSCPADFLTPGNFREMSSFPETKAEKWLMPSQAKLFLKYHRKQFSRVYPKGSRLDSSNYDPIRLWNCGVQMVSLNYQTPDRSMQLNQAKFRDNGASGYVLRPEFMFRDDFDPYVRKQTPGVNPLTLSIQVRIGSVVCCNQLISDHQVIGARHLTKSGRGIISPYVEIEIIGAEYDCNRWKSNIIRESCFLLEL